MYDDDYGRHKRHAFIKQTYGVDYEGSDNSELLEYWAVCGSYLAESMMRN